MLLQPLLSYAMGCAREIASLVFAALARHFPATLPRTAPSTTLNIQDKLLYGVLDAYMHKETHK